MDAIELKRLHELKKAADSQKRAELITATTAAKVKHEKQISDARGALINVALPYLQEVAAAFGQDFSVNASGLDASNESPVIVSFRIEKGWEYGIEAVAGTLRVWKRGLKNRADAANVPQFVFPPSAQPFIGTTADLTREKIGKLIEIAINEN